MFYPVKIFFLLFLLSLLLFFKVQFAVYPHLPEQANKTLLQSTVGAPRQVVLIIIDALRHDYIPRFDVVTQFMNKHPNSTFLAKSKVGNPTMTTQRIQSMMTGSEIFASGNILKTFLASKVDADNIISQLNAAKRKSAVLGDNTWVKLFDFSAEDAVCENTFDVHDLDTCDRVVYDNIASYLTTDNKTNYDFIVAHLLGIDHVGHSTSSLTAPSMEVKIKEFSRYLGHVFDQSAGNTLFIVTGDHGMRADGNHGGTSIEQVETFVFSYFKGGDMFRKHPKPSIVHSDLTTTLALLLGIPLPNNAIGYPIFNMVPAIMLSDTSVNEINIRLFEHFNSMLQFYNMPLSSEQCQEYKMKIEQSTDIKDQEVILDFIANKLNFLKYSAPDTTTILAVTCIVSLLPIAILFYIFTPQLVTTFTQCKGRLFLTLFCEGFPMFTLFISYFSWNMIQSLSDAIAAGFLIAAIFGILLTKSINRKMQSLIVVIGCFITLAQMEPNKSNDYKPSTLRVQFLFRIVTSRFFLAIVASLLLFVQIRSQLQRILKSRQSNRNYNPQATGMRIAISLLSYLHFMFMHAIQQPLYIFSNLQTIAIIAYLIYFKLIQGENNQAEAVHSVKVLIINFLSVFMGAHFPLVLGVCLIIQARIWHCYNYAIFMSLLSKCVWWWLGNRYEYSGVDILKTYVYSESYAIILNAFSLFIYLNSPFILSFTLINCRLTTPLVEQEGDSPSQTVLQRLGDQDMHQRQYSVSFVSELEEQNMKFSGVLLLGLVTSVWETIYNNEKILFTVVCVPILVLVSLVTLTTLLMVIVASFYYESKIKHQYEKVTSIAA